ncbi:MAG: CoA pyrophosphatase, partial [Novosphingobium sp.]
MSAVFDRLSRSHRESQEREPPTLFHDWSAVELQEFRPAAVLVAMTEREEPGMLLLHRPSNMRAHPGQVAFPGGKIDPGETPVEAALRETWEELGIRSSEVKVIGTGDVYRTHSGYEITPVLATVPQDIQINPNPAEVAQWFEAPVKFVLSPENQVERWVEWEGG